VSGKTLVPMGQLAVSPRAMVGGNARQTSAAAKQKYPFRMCYGVP